MTSPDIRWIQRLENFQRALSTLQRAIGLAQSRPLSELEEQGLIQAFEFTHELSWLLIRDFFGGSGGGRHQWLPRCGAGGGGSPAVAAG